MRCLHPCGLELGAERDRLPDRRGVDGRVDERLVRRRREDPNPRRPRAPDCVWASAPDARWARSVSLRLQYPTTYEDLLFVAHFGKLLNAIITLQPSHKCSPARSLSP